jgi:hypothetical protein
MNNVITFSALQSAVNNAYVAEQSRYDKLLALAIEHAKNGNKNVLANVDSKGRIHAPVEGYVWEHNDEVKIYGKGEFLPYTEDSLKKLISAKIAINVALFNDMKALFTDGSMGKSWFTKNGTEVAYFYTNVSTGVYSAIKSVIPTLGKQSFEKRKIVEVQEGEVVETASWKWSDAKAWNKIMKADCDFSLAECLYSAGLTWYYEQGRKIKGKLKENYTGLDGKMVKYFYIDDTIYS